MEYNSVAECPKYKVKSTFIRLCGQNETMNVRNESFVLLLRYPSCPLAVLWNAIYEIRRMTQLSNLTEYVVQFV